MSPLWPTASPAFQTRSRLPRAPASKDQSREEWQVPRQPRLRGRKARPMDGHHPVSDLAPDFAATFLEVPFPSSASKPLESSVVVWGPYTGRWCYWVPTALQACEGRSLGRSQAETWNRSKSHRSYLSVYTEDVCIVGAGAWMKEEHKETPQGRPA